MRPVDLPAHPFIAFTSVTCLPPVPSLPPLPITDMWQRTGAQHYGTVWPGPRSWPTAHRLQFVAPSCCRVRRTFSTPTCPRGCLPAPGYQHSFFCSTTGLSSPSPLTSLFFRMGRQFSPSELAFFAKDTPNLTATIRFAGGQSQNIRSIPAFSAQLRQWQAPASHLPALHDHRRRNEKCRVPSTHGRTV